MHIYCKPPWRGTCDGSIYQCIYWYSYQYAKNATGVIPAAVLPLAIPTPSKCLLIIPLVNIIFHTLVQPLECCAPQEDDWPPESQCLQRLSSHTCHTELLQTMDLLVEVFEWRWVPSVTVNLFLHACVLGLNEAHAATAYFWCAVLLIPVHLARRASSFVRFV